MRLGNRWLAIPLAAAMLSGCVASRSPLPAELVTPATEQIGADGLRVFGDADAEDVGPAFISSRVPPAGDRPQILFLSGGGDNGAYGAGFLAGWSERGTRPTFDVVIGVSAGALIAPFALLGPRHDEALREMFTQTQMEDFLRVSPVPALFGRPAVSDAAPFAQLIARYADEALLEAVADAHRNGRRLLVVTTWLDVQRPVVWNLGAIAASDRPDRLKLFRDVLQASASVPVIFPPVLFDVEIQGSVYDELHVDGGVTASLYPFGRNFPIRRLTARRAPPPMITVINNGKAQAAYDPVELDALDIAGHALTSLIRSQRNGDLYRLVDEARGEHLAVQVTLIPDTFVQTSDKFFEQSYTGALYQEGRKLGRAGAWADLGVPQAVRVAVQSD